MSKDITELTKLVESQEKQIKTLKQAILRLEKQLRSVSVVANRANHKSSSLNEQVQVIKSKIGK